MQSSLVLLVKVLIIVRYFVRRLYYFVNIYSCQLSYYGNITIFPP